LDFQGLSKWRIPLCLCFTFPEGKSFIRFFAPECVFGFMMVDLSPIRRPVNLTSSFEPGTDIEIDLTQR